MMLDNGIPLPDLFDDDDSLSGQSMNACSLKSSQSFSHFNFSSQQQQQQQNSSTTTDPFKSLSPYELATYLTDPMSHQFDQIIILDARFDYEYRGGKIRGARNINSKASMIGVYDRYVGMNVCFVFHCEFSHNRGPNLMRMFRDHDRRQNFKNYPFINYPSLFLLDGGYRKFYNEYPNLCIGGYVPMRDSEFIENGQLKKCHSFYSKNMLQNSRFTKPLKRWRSLSPRAMDAFGSSGDVSDSIICDLGFNFSASQPTFQ